MQTPLLKRYPLRTQFRHVIRLRVVEGPNARAFRLNSGIELAKQKSACCNDKSPP